MLNSILWLMAVTAYVSTPMPFALLTKPINKAKLFIKYTCDMILILASSVFIDTDTAEAGL